MLDTIYPLTRYVKYIVPVVFVIILSLKVVKSDLKNIHPVFFAFIIFNFWGLFISFVMTGSVKSLGLNDSLFIASYILPLCFFYTNTISIEKVFFIFTFFFAISCLGIEYQSFSMENSTAPFESGASFVFGVFFLYFLFQKNYKLMIISIIFLMLSLKRIAFLGVFICMAVYFLPEKYKKLILSKYSFIFFNFICLAIILGLGFGVYDDIIIQLTGMNVHHFTMGRFSHYQGVIQEIEAHPWSLIFGNGIGTTYDLASIYVNTDFTVVNLHSDTLKIFFESGFVVFSLFFLFLGQARKTTSKLIMLYLVVLLFTDNVLIYLGTMFFVLLIFLKLENSSENEIKF
jgi:hypothetical protein